jgi:hypothetical protein
VNEDLKEFLINDESSVEKLKINKNPPIPTFSM